MQSDTPRTDAENYIYDIGLVRWVSIEFARQLERDLAAAIKQRDEARENLRDACDEIATRVNASSMLSMNKTAEIVAEERGWDCFKDGGGA